MLEEGWKAQFAVFSTKGVKNRHMENIYMFTHTIYKNIFLINETARFLPSAVGVYLINAIKIVKGIIIKETSTTTRSQLV